MAGRLSKEQESEIAGLFADAADKKALSTPQDVVNLLRSSKQSVLTEAEVDSVASAIAALQSQERPSWRTEGPRGHFFVFEGLDRSGKSTQSKMLSKVLEQTGQVRWTCFPNRETPTGLLIDLYLRRTIELPDDVIHLLFSANRWETAKIIVEDLAKGTSIVCDRYAFSGVAYSAAKGMDFVWCQACDRGLPCPDAVFYLHVDEKVGASRANFGDERYENAQMQGRVRQEFKSPELRTGVAWHDVDGARDIDVIHAEILEAVRRIREAEQGTLAVGRLWE